MRSNYLLFIDSDVIISALLSNKGASYLLFKLANTTRLISNYSLKELSKVANRLNITQKKLNLTTNKCSCITISENLEKIKLKYQKYVKDINDAHIINGAVNAKARYLITYNTKDYYSNLIKKDFNILILTPGMFLQYLRSQN